MKTQRSIQFQAHCACFAAYAIFGFNIVICKDLTSGRYISPLALFTIRALCAATVFWLLSIFNGRIVSDSGSVRSEKPGVRRFAGIELRDLPKILCASFLGFFVTQLTFLMAIPQVTPMTCSIISSLSPVYTMFIAAVAIKEPLTWKKAIGVAVSFAGILFLIVSSAHPSASGTVANSVQGIMLMLANGIAFSLYLGVFKPLISKYPVVDFMKWIFTFSILMSLPFSARELLSAGWGSFPSSFWLELSFLVVFATVLSYYLIPYGQKHLRPTLVSMYSYVQPIVATLISIVIGMDMLDWQKVLSAVMVFGGVVMVNRSKGAAVRN